MKVKFWDGSEKIVANRDEAIQVINDALSNKKQPSDKIEWNYARLFESQFPTIATVFSIFGEATDIGAVIVENHS